MLVKGPFSIKWGENPVVDVSEIGFNYDVATNDYQTVDGRTYTVDSRCQLVRLLQRVVRLILSPLNVIRPIQTMIWILFPVMVKLPAW